MAVQVCTTYAMIFAQTPLPNVPPHPAFAKLAPGGKMQGLYHAEKLLLRRGGLQMWLLLEKTTEEARGRKGAQGP